MVQSSKFSEENKCSEQLGTRRHVALTMVEFGVHGEVDYRWTPRQRSSPLLQMKGSVQEPVKT